MRHGDAVDARASGNDESRWLTDFGRDECARTAIALRASDPRVQQIFSSPYVRARQTAEIAAKALGLLEPIGDIGALIPEGDPHEVLRQLSELGDVASVLLAGHEPSMHRIAALLTGQSSFPAFEKSEIISVEWGPDRNGVVRFRAV